MDATRPVLSPPHAPVPRSTRSQRIVLCALGIAIAAGVLGFVVAAFILLRPPAAAPENIAPGRFGGIEIGAKGVKPIVIDFMKTPSGYDFAVASSDDKDLKEANTDLGALRPDNNREFDPDRIDATVKVVGVFSRRMQDHYKLPPERVYVVVSSGVISGFAADAIGPARAALTERLMAGGGGHKPVFVATAQEAEYAARGTIAPDHRGQSLMIDIGSGNTKIGYFHPDGFKTFSVEFGTTRLQREVTKRAEAAKRPYTQVLAELQETLIAKPLRAQLSADPRVLKLSEAHLVGGAAWALANYTQPQNVREARVKVRPADVTRFTGLAGLSPVEARKQILADLTDAGLRGDAELELERVQKVFTPEQLAAGGAILQAVADECHFGDKEVQFFRKGQYAWIAGYLTEAAGLKD